MEQKDNKKQKWYIIGFVAIIVFAIIASIMNGGEKRDYSQKDTITYNDVEYSIKKVEKDGEYLNVIINAKNKGTNTISYSNFHFSMINEKGEFIDKKKLVVDDGTIFTSGELKPNEEVEGKVIWEYKEENKDLRVRYYENFIMSKIDDYEFQWSLDN